MGFCEPLADNLRPASGRFVNAVTKMFCFSVEISTDDLGRLANRKPLTWERGAKPPPQPTETAVG